MKRALCEESILRIFDVWWHEKVHVFKMTVVVICSCKVFKKVLLVSFPAKIGKIKRHFFCKNVNDKKYIFQIFAQPHVLIIACSTFLLSTFFISKQSSKNQQRLIVNNFWVYNGSIQKGIQERRYTFCVVHRKVHSSSVHS